jgi:glutamine amidotransferase
MNSSSSGAPLTGGAPGAAWVIADQHRAAVEDPDVLDRHERHRERVAEPDVARQRRPSSSVRAVCRLFGMHAGEAVRATFWLLEAPDSLAVQSRSNPDGYGLATFGAGGAVEVEKRPVAAYEDEEFAREARERESPTFLAHVRYASVGPLVPENTHPFARDGLVFAHNGHIEGLDALERRLGDHRALVRGDTDSERFFALVCREADARDGDVAAGLEAAARWIAQELPTFALNCVLATATDVWALRYPDVHDLLVLERARGGPSGRRHFDGASAAGRIRVRSGALAEGAAVVVATEPMDEDPGWSALAPGELLHVARDLRVTRRVALPEPPRHALRLADLEPAAAASQRRAA